MTRRRGWVAAMATVPVLALLAAAPAADASRGEPPSVTTAVITGHITWNNSYGQTGITLFRLAETGAWVVVDTNGIYTDRPATRSYTFPTSLSRPLGPGIYRVCARLHYNEDDPHPTRVFAPECYGGPTVETATDIVVGEGGSADEIDITVDEPASLGGVLSGVNRSVPVTLLTTDGRPVVASRTDSRGAYHFSSLHPPVVSELDLLPAGDYRLAYDRKFSRSPYAAEFYRNVTEERGLSASQVITVPADGHFDAYNSLAIGGEIRGRLLDTTGNPPGGTCQVRVDAAGLTSRYALTASDGTFRIRGLTTGAYVVQIRLGKCSVSSATSLFVSDDAPGHLVTRWRDSDPVAVTRGAVTTLPYDLVAP